jgi:hypothetical protein
MQYQVRHLCYQGQRAGFLTNCSWRCLLALNHSRSLLQGSALRKASVCDGNPANRCASVCTRPDCPYRGVNRLNAVFPVDGMPYGACADNPLAQFGAIWAIRLLTADHAGMVSLRGDLYPTQMVILICQASVMFGALFGFQLRLGRNIEPFGFMHMNYVLLL